MRVVNAASHDAVGIWVIICTRPKIQAQSNREKQEYTGIVPELTGSTHFRAQRKSEKRKTQYQRHVAHGLEQRERSIMCQHVEERDECIMTATNRSGRYELSKRLEASERGRARQSK